ncbi:MAG: DUF763 domain-containing protein [Candidatus Pacebacteria bacterium]|nr:DUF763 domain-containing protein [Candidatus Paceibacterota bacterium]
MRTGIATIPLDTGQCPKWLFERMRRLAKGITIAIIDEFGSKEMLKRLSDPVWFQSFSSVMGWDWNSSGATPVALAALKDGIKGLENELGIFICGGKGKTSKKTPEQIKDWGEFLHLSLEKIDNLIYTSRISAKVDSALIQDNFQIYHHNFIFDKTGNWTVVQQGMNTGLQKARRYHWLSSGVKDFITQPHSGIISDVFLKPLNLTAKESDKNREISLSLAKDEPKGFLKDFYKIIDRKDLLVKQKRFDNFTELELIDREFHWHPVVNEKFDLKRLRRTIFFIKSRNPVNFEELLSFEGVGPKTIRALSLVSEIIYGAKPSYTDPARYSFSVGGKDGTPYFVRRDIYDRMLDVIEKGIKKSNVTIKEKQEALERLNNIC